VHTIYLDKEKFEFYQNEKHADYTDQ